MRNQEIEVIQIKTGTKGVQRLAIIADEFGKLLDQYQGQIEGVAIEGYAFGAKGAVFNLGELGGVLRLEVYKRGLPLIEVPPTTLKKHITGKGTSAKQVMIKDLYKNFDIDTNDDNDADAISLAIVAQEFYETEYHAIKAYRTDLHKNCALIVGQHPNFMDVDKYFEGHEDLTVAQYEKTVRKKKKWT